MGGSQNTRGWFRMAPLVALLSLASLIAGVGPAQAAPPGPEASLAVGDDHSCFIIPEGRITCVGDGDSGQLGDGTNFEDRRTPILVTGIDNAIAVSAGEDHTCAVLATGVVMCWGDNDNGQLGNGEIGDDQFDRSSPVRVIGITDAVAIAAGDNHTCAVRSNGTVKCWGDNSDGQLGNASTADSPIPVFVKNIGRAQQISAGQFHTCMVSSDDFVSCWGDNSNGQLGNGTTNDSLVARRVLRVSRVNSLAAGFGHTCASEFTGAVKCWGKNDSGQLGNGTTTPTGQASVVSGISNGRQVSVGYRTSCAMDASTVKCWGNNEFGQLGTGNLIPSTVPVAVAWTGGPVTAVGVGDDHNCLISDARQIACWGINADGQLGRGDYLDQLTPSLLDAEAFISITQLPPPTAIDELVNRPDFKRAHADVLRLYQAFFARGPDLGGAIFWIGEYEKGDTIGRIADRFTGTPEFKGFYDGTTDAEFMTRVYQNVLLRGPDASGLQFWLDQMANGMSRGNVVRLFASANEFVDNNRFGGL